MSFLVKNDWGIEQNSSEWSDYGAREVDRSLPVTLHEVMPNTSLRLVLMLYDGALAALDKIEESMVAQDAQAGADALAMINDIIGRLHLSLDFAAGGEIASNLGRIYRYILGCMRDWASLSDASLLSSIEEVREILSQLHQSWQDIDQHVSVTAA